MIAVSRAPWEKLEAFKRRMGWNFKWFSSGNNDFNYDYHVSFTPEALKGEIEYNYGKWEKGYSDLPGVSVFYKDGDGNIFSHLFCLCSRHRYSEYGIQLPRFGS